MNWESCGKYTRQSFANSPLIASLNQVKRTLPIIISLTVLRVNIFADFRNKYSKTAYFSDVDAAGRTAVAQSVLQLIDHLRS